MAIIKVLKFKSGVATSIDAGDNIAAQSFVFGGEAGTELTQTMVNALVGESTDASSLHNHDSTYYGKAEVYTKAEVDGLIQSKDSAAEISFDNTGIDISGNGASVTNIQDALAAVDARLDAVSGGSSTTQADLDTLEAQYAAHIAGTADKHAAQDISFADAAFVATDVKAAVIEAKAAGVDAAATEQARAEAAEGQLSDDIAAEATRAQSAEGALQDAIDDEETRALAAEGVLQDAIDAEALARASADTALQDAIDDEETRALAAEGQLASDILAEKSRAEGAEGAIQDDLDLFKATKGAASGLASLDASGKLLAAQLPDLAITSTTVVADMAARDALSWSAEKEGDVAVVTDSGDGYPASFIWTGASWVRLNAPDALNAEVTRAQNAEAQLTLDLAQEISDRADDVDAEEARALAAEGVLQDAIDAEALARASADSDLQDQIDAMSASSSGDVSQLRSDLDDEIARAQSAEGQIASDLAQEISDRVDDVDAEEARALAAEGALQTAIDDEETRALAAEGVLQDAIDAEALTRASADSGLQSAIDDEETRALAAESVLQDAIDAEALARASADSDLQDQIDALDASSNGDISQLRSDLDDEIARAQAAEGQLDIDIVAEKDRAEAAEGQLSLDIAAEATARASADTTIQNDLNSFRNTKAQPSGLASLDSNGKLPNAQVPQIAIVDTYVAADQAAMLALGSANPPAEQGDVAVRSDLNKSFILLNNDPSQVANWQELLTPTDAVLAVNSKVGSVQLDALDIPTSPITGVTGDDVQEVLESLKSQIDSTSAAGANKTLSNLTAPTAVNETLNMGADKSVRFSDVATTSTFNGILFNGATAASKEWAVHAHNAAANVYSLRMNIPTNGPTADSRSFEIASGTSGSTLFKVKQSGAVDVTGSIVPDSASTRNLGSPTNYFNFVYAGGGSGFKVMSGVNTIGGTFAMQSGHALISSATAILQLGNSQSWIDVNSVTGSNSYLDMKGVFKIANLKNPTANQDAATKIYVDDEKTRAQDAETLLQNQIDQLSDNKANAFRFYSAGESILTGDLVVLRYHATYGIAAYKASALAADNADINAGTSKWEAFGVADSGGSAGDQIKIKVAGTQTCTFDVSPTAADAGKSVYLGTDGKATLTPPSSAGDAIVYLGRCIGSNARVEMTGPQLRGII